MYYCALLASSGGILALFTWKLLKFLCSVQVENKLYGAQLLKSARSLLLLECLSIFVHFNINQQLLLSPYQGCLFFPPVYMDG
jgi:hypothetical protein